MGLTTAMYTGLSGMNVNQTAIDTIGHNIANVNTNSFKGSRTLFQSQYSRLLSIGNGPTDTSGGVNPTQVGLGAVIATTQRSFSPGSIETTGIASDLAIDGNGFFILRDADNRQIYTRDGAFTVDSDNRLVSVDGHAVRGFGIDDGFNIIPNVLTDLTIPLGTLSVARATENAIMDGDLSAASTIATQGSISQSQQFVSGGGGAADATTALTDLRSAAAPGATLFADGNTITVSGITKGNRTLPAATFTIGTDGATLGDFSTWLSGVMGIQQSADVSGTPGITIVNGSLVIESNAGEPNAIEITGNDLVSDNAAASLPFSFTQTQSAVGSGEFTSFTVYDSLGTPVTVQATFTLDSTPVTGPVWRYYLETAGENGQSTVLGTGTVTFDTQGNFLSADGNQISIDRSASGAASPLQVTLDFSGVHGLSTRDSAIIAADQDGFPPGTLTDFGIGNDGTVTGTFSNGSTQVLGQVAVAMFANQAGLVAENDNVYVQGPNTGEPLVTAPGLFGAGAVLGGSLELSNVDLAQQFIGLITSSAGFQASSRVISTSSDMLDQLLLIVR